MPKQFEDPLEVLRREQEEAIPLEGQESNPFPDVDEDFDDIPDEDFDFEEFEELEEETKDFSPGWPYSTDKGYATF